MFFKNIHIRIKLVLLGIFLIFIIIILKVFYIEVIDYKKLNKYASNLWSRNLPIKADRGIIYDRNGEILAISARPNFSQENYKNYSIEEINRNLPVWATYEPGSTFKIITLSAASQENKVDLDKDTLFDYIDNKFGFGKKTGVDLNGESTEILFDRSKVGPVELATTVFGHGVSVTTIHLTV